MNQKGFTLIELVVVMAMIGILAITSMVGYDRFIQRAEEAKAAEVIKNIQTELYAESAFTGIRTGVLTQDLGAAFITVIYDQKSDTLIFRKDNVAPTNEEIVNALVNIFQSHLDMSSFVYNSSPSSENEVINFFVDPMNQLMVQYFGSFGGATTWFPNTRYETLHQSSMDSKRRRYRHLLKSIIIPKTYRSNNF